MATEFSDLFRCPDVVAHILSFLPSPRWNASLVCKDFYKHVCEIEKDDYKLLLNLVRYLNMNISMRHAVIHIFPSRFQISFMESS